MDRNYLHEDGDEGKKIFDFEDVQVNNQNAWSEMLPNDDYDTRSNAREGSK